MDTSKISDTITQIRSNPNFNKFVIVFIVGLIVFYIAKKIYDYQNTIDQTVIDSNLKKGDKPLVIENSKLPLAKGIYENTYSSWMYINNMNVQQKKATHLFHIGNKEMTKLGPGVWLHPYKNNLVIKFSLLNKETRFTDGKFGRAPANKQCVFPYRINWPTIGMQKPAGVGNNPFISTCAQTADSTSVNGYCPVRVNSQGFVESINDYGSCSPNSMDPNVNNGLLNTHLCDVENVPLKRWFHLAITVNNDVIEVYIDGKLVKTCVAESLPFINEGNMYFFNDYNFDGVVGITKAFPYTMSATQINDLYMLGPNEDNSLLGFLKKAFNLSLKVTFTNDVDLASNQPKVYAWNISNKTGVTSTSPSASTSSTTSSNTASTSGSASYTVANASNTEPSFTVASQNNNKCYLF